MHIELNVSGSRIRYDAGDHVAIYPQNDQEVRFVFKRVLGKFRTAKLLIMYTLKSTKY